MKDGRLDDGEESIEQPGGVFGVLEDEGQS
jgi:hypothetical protein